MRPDLISILLGVAIRVAETAIATEAALFLLFIVVVLIVGSAWALSVVTTAWLKNRARVFFINA